MTTTIVLPRLVGTRNAAYNLVEDAFAGDVASAKEVEISARAVLAAAPSFVDALITSLDEHGVNSVTLVGASNDLVTEMKRAASRHPDLAIKSKTREKAAV
ncbi:hypothetical protein [Agreia sp. VKM Ac-1783]|uniref:hypothetical protein n=1 Tax=Agreia sp. VKM Ac-1783 TaxID=1938889 RepID=UPI00112381DA|nr:hypothetical protein [Agreia sp. VKM Ac-1783]